MTYPFIGARWFTPDGNVEAGKIRIDRIVIHDEEYRESVHSAEDIGRMFQSTTTKKSAHFGVDADGVTQYVQLKDVAYHAPPNRFSIGIEHDGFSKQTREEWLDPQLGLKTLTISAALTRELCAHFDVPIVWLSVQDLLAGKRGITSHNNVSIAWKQSTHTDPGPQFPVDTYLDLVKGPQPEPQPIEEEEDMPLFIRESGTSEVWLVAGDKLVYMANANQIDDILGKPQGTDPNPWIRLLASDQRIWKLERIGK